MIGTAAIPIIALSAKSMNENNKATINQALFGVAVRFGFSDPAGSDGGFPSFRLAIAGATRSPDIAQALEVAGREATRGALAELLANAQSSGLIGSGEPTEMAAQYLGLLWEGFMVGLLWGCHDARVRRVRATSNRGDDGVYAAPSRCCEKLAPKTASPDFTRSLVLPCSADRAPCSTDLIPCSAA
jgi:hypothetical protein